MNRVDRPRGTPCKHWQAQSLRQAADERHATNPCLFGVQHDPLRDPPDPPPPVVRTWRLWPRWARPPRTSRPTWRPFRGQVWNALDQLQTGSTEETSTYFDRRPTWFPKEEGRTQDAKQTRTLLSGCPVWKPRPVVWGSPLDTPTGGSREDMRG